jgi:acetylornithine deacetylase/succinyl-diaminopimelate desuccinylase-like protein
MIEGGHAENALPQTARAIVNCRLLPGHAPAEVEAKLRGIMQKHQVNVKMIDRPQPSPASPLLPEVIEAVGKTVNKLWPELRIVPEMETGATDGLWLRRAGIPTYGIAGTGYDVDDVRFHGKDERVRVKNFCTGLEFEYQLIRTVTGSER